MRGEDRSNALAICAAVLCVMMTIGLAFALSGKGIIGAMLFEGVDGESVYFVCSGPYDDLALAKSSAELAKSRGGAGYVISGDGSCEIALSAYASEGEATSVSNAIAGSYVKRIDIKKSRLKWADDGVKSATLAALDYYRFAFSGLNECANGLNSQALNIDDVKIKIDVLYEQIGDIKSTYCNNVQDESDQRIVSVKVAIVTALALLDNLTLNLGDAKALSSLRYAAIQLALSRQALMQNL